MTGVQTCALPISLFFPWFWTWDEKSDDFIGGEKFDGARWNDPHYSLAVKQKARDRTMQLEEA